MEEMSKANNFHKSFPQYEVTPLTRLSRLAEYLGLKRLYVKDESYRFGLNAFKVLGGSYGIARYIAQQTGKDVSEIPYDVLTSEKLREEFGQAAFFTAEVYRPDAEGFHTDPSEQHCQRECHGYHRRPEL